MQVYGMPIKEIIHEKFGDGIMSAIDFTLDIEKEEDLKGDRTLFGDGCKAEAPCSGGGAASRKIGDFSAPAVRTPW